MRPDEPSAVGGGGLAEERTELAWGRNGLSLLVCGAVLVRHVTPLVASGRRPVAGLVTVAMALAVVVVEVVHRRRRRALAVANATSMRMVAYSTGALAAVAAVIAALPT